MIFVQAARDRLKRRSGKQMRSTLRQRRASGPVTGFAASPPISKHRVNRHEVLLVRS